MERTKLTSIRLETEIVEKIEEIIKRESYYKRSDVINNLLRCVLTKFTTGQVHYMMQRWRWDYNKCITNFEVTQELEPYKPKQNG